MPKALGRLTRTSTHHSPLEYNDPRRRIQQGCIPASAGTDERRPTHTSEAALLAQPMQDVRPSRALKTLRSLAAVGLRSSIGVCLPICLPIGSGATGQPDTPTDADHAQENRSDRPGQD